MEETKPARDPPIENTATPPPQPPPNTRKRPLDIEDSNYYKIRALVKDIRPHLLEVLRTVDFRTCKGADEVKEKLKLLMELYKRMTAETVSITKIRNASEGQPLPGENGAGLEKQEQVQQPLAKPTESKNLQSAPVSEMLPAEDGEKQGTYIVGGSAFGWNFITYPGGKPVYYGRTKESFRIV